MVAPGAEDRHLQGVTRLVLYPRCDRLHTGGYSSEDQVWLQHPPTGGRLNETVWVEAEALPYRGGASGTLPSAPDLEPVGIAGLIHAHRQQDHQHGGCAGFTAVWEVLPPHPAGGFVGGSGPGFGPGVQTGCYRRVQPWHC